MAQAAAGGTTLAMPVPAAAGGLSSLLPLPPSPMGLGPGGSPSGAGPALTFPTSPSNAGGPGRVSPAPGQATAAVAAPGAPPLETCRCFALVCEAPNPAQAGSRFLARAATVQAYLDANRLLVAWQGSAAQGAGGSAWGALTGIQKQRGAVVGADVAVQRGAQFRHAVIGPRCTVGSGVKLNDCVVMAGAALGERAIVQNSVVCAGASVGEDCVLKNCQVAAGFSVPAGTRGTDESFNARPGGDQSSDEEDEGFDEGDAAGF